jgi:hypothetical protein
MTLLVEKLVMVSVCMIFGYRRSRWPTLRGARPSARTLNHRNDAREHVITGLPPNGDPLR